MSDTNLRIPNNQSYLGQTQHGFAEWSYTKFSEIWQHPVIMDALRFQCYDYGCSSFDESITGLQGL